MKVARLGSGGPGRVRTDDLFHAMEARSQLRHRPTREVLFHYIMPVSLPWSRRNEMETKPIQDGAKSRWIANKPGTFFVSSLNRTTSGGMRWPWKPA